MNCPSRTDNADGRDGWNQSPNLLSATTREDFNGMANTRILRRIESNDPVLFVSNNEVPDAQRPRKTSAAAVRLVKALTSQSLHRGHVNRMPSGCDDSNNQTKCPPTLAKFLTKARNILVTFSKFIGPGFMVSSVELDR
jgi:metal iron transporter